MAETQNKDKSPKISIIVPVYNVEKYLHRCIDSILSQTFTDFELILVDDGSPDGCPAICDEYAKQDNRVRVIHQENKGVSAARNAGLDVVCGEWVGFVDSDDWIEPDMYEVAYRVAVEKSADLVQWNIIMEQPEKRTLTKLKEGDFSIADDATYFEPSMWQKLISRKLISANNIRYPQNIRLSEDRLVSLQCYLQSDACYQIESALYHYYARENSASHIISKEMILEEAYVIELMERLILQRKSKKYEEFIYSQKCECKRHCVLYMKKSDFDLCRSLFQEINKIILHDRTKFSILFFFIYFHFDFLAKLLIQVWKIIRKS